MINQINDTIIVTGHDNYLYNGEYTRGNDWNDTSHFVMGDRHLYF